MYRPLQQLSFEGLRQLRRQLRELKQERRGLRKRLVELRAAKEEAAFNDDVERMEQLERTIQRLQYLLFHSRVLQITRKDGTVQLGSVVKLQQADKELEWRLVSSVEADPSLGKISDESPLGRALIGKSAKASIEVASPRGNLIYKIKSVGYFA